MITSFLSFSSLLENFSLISLADREGCFPSYTPSPISFSKYLPHEIYSYTARIFTLPHALLLPLIFKQSHLCYWNVPCHHLCGKCLFILPDAGKIILFYEFHGFPLKHSLWLSSELLSVLHQHFCVTQEESCHNLVVCTWNSSQSSFKTQWNFHRSDFFFLLQHVQEKIKSKWWGLARMNKGEN